MSTAQKKDTRQKKKKKNQNQGHGHGDRKKKILSSWPTFPSGSIKWKDSESDEPRTLSKLALRYISSSSWSIFRCQLFIVHVLLNCRNFFQCRHPVAILIEKSVWTGGGGFFGCCCFRQCIIKIQNPYKAKK